MENWLRFSDPRFELEFQYPDLASDGESVDRVETQFEGMLRIHVLSPISREVYFEVSRYEALSAEDEYQRHKAHLPEQFHPLTITDLEEVMIGSLPAYEYTFEWEQDMRTVLLVERENVTYRILYNPRFAVNLQILSTIEWLNPP